MMAVSAPSASSTADVEPARERVRRRAGRLTEPSPDEGVSAAEFEQMKRDLEIEERSGRATSTLTKRLAHTPGADAPAPRAKAKPAAKTPGKQARTNGPQPAAKPAADPAVAADPPPAPSAPPAPAPDIAENEGMAQMPKAKPAPRKSGSRNRRHGRPR